MRTFNKTTLMLGTLLSTAMLATTAHAQGTVGDQNDVAIDILEDQLDRQINDEIVVTGSRIQRSLDFVANSPVATVDAVQFDRLGTVNTEQLLNVIPQTVPGLTRTSNNPGNGTATVDLRGLGSNRTLVLVNGRRAQPTGSGGVVDINTIPPALVERVEVLTGGASSVYGADAVAGVVNFILKDDFEGAEARANFQITEEGDAETYGASLTVGGNFADDRGNAVATIGYTERSPLLQRDRDFTNVTLFDDGNGGLEPGGSSGVPGTSIFAGGLGDFSPSFGGIFDPSGSFRPFVTSGQTNDFFNFAPFNYLQLPQERYTAYAKADYEVNENMEFFLEGRFVQSEVPQQLAPTPIFQTTTFSLDNNPFIDRAAQQVLSDAIGSGVDTDGDGVDDTARALLRRRLLEVGPRIGSDTRNTFQLIGGLRGDITDQFGYEVFYSEGRTNNSSFQEGNVNRGRFEQALLLADDGNGNVDTANLRCADQSNNGSTVGCTPLNIFGEGNISPEAAQFLRTAVSTTDETIQRVLQANVSGEFGEGLRFTDTPVGIALGAEYIENEFEFRPSQDVAASTIAGFNGAPPVAGGFNVYSAYGELSIPLLEGMNFVDGLTLDLAGRVSDFSTAGTEYNYKIGGDWVISDILRIRGNYNTAVRSPNIGELFSPQGENFPGADDPCSASGGFVGNAAVEAICLATGVPANAVFSPAIDPASGQIRSLAGGNPNLEVETAETYTIGAVLSPGLFDNFTLSVDYYDIQIDNIITTFGGGTDNILETCYTNAELGGVGSVFCDQVNRRGDGTIDFVSNLAANAAFLSTSGLDIAMNVSLGDEMLGGLAGEVYASYLGNYVFDNEFQAFAGDTVFDSAGGFGNNLGEPDPEYDHFVTLGSQKGIFNTQLTWQMLGGVDDGFLQSAGATEDDAPTVASIGDEHYFNASVTADVLESTQITLGINNLLDNNPPVIGDNDEQANTYPSTYDVFGRTFFASVRFGF